MSLKKKSKSSLAKHWAIEKKNLRDHLQRMKSKHEKWMATN